MECDLCGEETKELKPTLCPYTPEGLLELGVKKEDLGNEKVYTKEGEEINEYLKACQQCYDERGGDEAINERVESFK